MNDLTKNKNKKHDLVASVTDQAKGLPQASNSDAGLPHNTGPSGSGVEGKLSKSQKRNRRKYKALLDKQQANTPSGSGVGAVKRVRSDDTTPSPSSKQAPAKRPRENLPQRSYKQVVSGTKMAIIRLGFPRNRLTLADVESIQKTLVNRIDNTPPEDSLPHFSSSGLNKGAFTVQCENDFSMEWLISTFHQNTSIIKETQLLVIKASELPKPVKVAFKHRDVHTTDPQILLKRLNRLNPNLDTSCWRVLGRSSESQSARWIFEVDLESAEAIKEANFVAYAGLDLGTFKVLSSPPEFGGAVEESTDAGGVATASGGSEIVPMEAQASTEAGGISIIPVTEDVEEAENLKTGSEVSDSVLNAITDLDFSDSDSINTLVEVELTSVEEHSTDD